MQDALRKAGMSEGEVKIYLAITAMGISTLNNIHEKTAIERRHIYDILNKLIEKGLVSYTQEQGRKTFQVTHPRQLLAHLDEQKKERELTRAAVARVVPELERMQRKRKQVATSENFRGKEGFKALAEDMLRCKDVWIIGGGGEVQKQLPGFWQAYNKRRIAHKVMWHDLIVPGTLMRTFREKDKGRLNDEYYEYRTLPIDTHHPNTICIYGDTVVNMLWDDGLFAVAIRSDAIANSYLKHFKYLWKRST